MKKTLAVLVLLALAVVCTAAPASAQESNADFTYRYVQQNNVSERELSDVLGAYDDRLSGTGMNSRMLIDYRELTGYELTTENKYMRLDYTFTDEPYNGIETGGRLEHDVFIYTIQPEGDVEPKYTPLFGGHPYVFEPTDIVRYRCWYGDFFGGYEDDALRFVKEYCGAHENAEVCDRKDVLSAEKRAETLAFDKESLIISELRGATVVLYLGNEAPYKELFVVRGALAVRISALHGESINVDNMLDIAERILSRADAKSGRTAAFIVCGSVAFVLLVAGAFLLVRRGKKKAVAAVAEPEPAPEPEIPEEKKE